MAHDILALMEQVRSKGKPYGDALSITAWGRTRTLSAFQYGADTYVIENELSRVGVENKSPIIVARNDALRAGAEGMFFSLTSGHHGVVSVPLLSGELWGLASVAPRRRSEVLRTALVCGSSVGGLIELAQRETPTDLVVTADDWLLHQGWGLDHVVLTDRVDQTLEHYRRRGQEWRIRPLAWTHEEMVAALRANLTSIHTPLKYYHSVKGIHFLTYARFKALTDGFDESFEDFLLCLKELAGMISDASVSFMRSEKYHGHHEVELFGLRPGVAEALLMPEIEHVLIGLTSGALSCDQARRSLYSVRDAFRNALIDPDLADEQSNAFVETMYRHLTGEVYQGSPHEVVPAFDDRKTALPGATYVDGVPQTHPGTDVRSLAILDYINTVLSHGERIEYLNIYEIRGARRSPLGSGQTREIVFKTNHRPLPHCLIEKRLAHKSTGYGNYTLARVMAFQALGISYGPHHLLERRDGKIGDVHYYIRERYPGEPYGAIPRNRFLPLNAKGDSMLLCEDSEVVLMLAALMGQAASENLILKKYLPDERGNRFGVGKEIVEFGYNVRRGRELPMRVRLCSVRGTMGWEDVSETDENLGRILSFFIDSFAHVMLAYFTDHSGVASLHEIGNAFFEGFASKTREMCWNYTCRREQFDDFDPQVDYDFKRNWKFVLWALQEQRARLDEIQDLFFARLHTMAVDVAAASEAVANATPDGPS